MLSHVVLEANGVGFSQSPEVSGTQEGHSDAKRAVRVPLNYVSESAANDPHSVE